MKISFLPSRYTVIILAAIFLFANNLHAQTYCTPSFLQGCTFGDEINDFTLAGESGTNITDLATGCAGSIGGGYDNRTGESVTLKQGTSYTVHVDDAAGAILPDNFQVWIDFDHDGVFSSSESIGGGALPLILGITTGALTSFTLTIPPGAALGTHRMRAEVSGSDVYPSVNPCPTVLASPDGEVHDYTVVIITSTTTCSPPTGLAATSVTTTSATVNWTPATGAIGAEYAVNTTATAPPTGTGTTLSSIPVSGLTASTLYYLHVRDSCSASSLSTWVTIPFTTLSLTCDTVSGLAVSAITATGATVSWAAVTGSSGYQYVINTVATSPGGSGTNTSATSTNPTGLTAGTLYYAHVRDSCGLSNFSAWVTRPFTTLNPALNINNNNGTDFGIVAYPNPIKNTVTVGINGNIYGNAQLELTDVTGKLIMTMIMDNYFHIICMDSLSPGIYFIRFIDAGHAQTIKVIKQ